MAPILKSRVEHHRGHSVLAFPAGSRPLVIDAGAHRGEFAASVHAAWNARCHAIEASPALFARLALPPGTRAHHFALGGADGTATFALADNPEASRAVGGDAAGITVPARGLGSFLAEVAPDGVDLLKLDIEGAEIAALASLGDDQLAAIGQLTVEFHDWCGQASRAEVDRAIARLRGLGFVAFNLSFHNRSDMLFVNRRSCRLSAWDRWRIGVWHRFSAGLRRIVARRLAA
ncbi:MAG TPA: FkbM family methyltransferase [Croceibacterium sp.]|nr:FkbM family methyltransferase [Croceibacterium sp.]